MEIEKGILPNGRPLIRFKDQFDEPCRISVSGASTSFLKFHIVGVGSAQLSQEDIQALLPYLQSFAETGQLEPTQEPTLQGEETQLIYAAVIEDPSKRIQALLELFQKQDNRIDDLVETTACMNYRNYRYEQLLLEWKKYGQPSSDSKSPDELVHLTDQIIRESALSVEGSNEIEKANRGKAYYQRQCDQYVDQVANLEELVEEWRNIVERGSEASHLNNLQERTIKLLGE